MKTAVIIVTGAPASGKTTLATELSERFKIPLIRKDAIKELLFESLGWSDREWSRRVGAATYELMHLFAETELSCGRPIMLESNFKTNIDTEVFRAWKQKYGCRYFQVFCHAPVEVLRERFEERLRSGGRHPGHVDQENLGLFDRKDFAEVFAPLLIDGGLVKYDSTVEPAEQIEAIAKRLEEFLASSI